MIKERGRGYAPMHSNMQPYEVARINRTSAIDTMMIKNDEQTLIYVSDDGQKK